MFLHRLHLNLRSREARRDLADPYQLHSTLCRAFSGPERKCAEGEFLWRLEPETDCDGCPRVLVQSRSLPEWSRIGLPMWFAQPPDPPIDLAAKLSLDRLRVGQTFRFRLRANPCACRLGKRQALYRTDEQEAWLARKGCQQHGFSLPRLSMHGQQQSSAERYDVQISQEQMLRGSRRDGGTIRVYSVLYDGILTVTDPVQFLATLLGNADKKINMGVGHGRAMGLGLLSVVPIK